MSDFVRDFMEYDFWRRAVIGGLLISVICSLLSVYVVLKRMAFIGQGISHSALGGFALGVLLFAGTAGADYKIYATALVFCLCVAGAIAATTRRSKLSEDSAIGIFFVASMALGVVFFRAAPGYNQDVTTFLFGSVMVLNRADLIAITMMTPIVILLLTLFHKELLYYTFDEDMAQVAGVPVNMLHYMLLTLLSLTIVVSARMVGILLISALLILPGATAQLLSMRFTRLLFISVAIGLVTTLGGLFISNLYPNWPAGPSIVLVQFSVFMIVFAVRKLQGRLSV